MHGSAAHGATLAHRGAILAEIGEVLRRGVRQIELHHAAAGLIRDRHRHAEKRVVGEVRSRLYRKRVAMDEQGR